MKAKSKTAVLKGGVTDPRLPGKVFFGPGAMQTGFILRKFREQVAEIGEELTARIKGARAFRKRVMTGVMRRRSSYVGSARRFPRPKPLSGNRLRGLKP